MSKLVGALDQGTTSTRFMIFDQDGTEVAKYQLPHRQILPAPGWVEHDPLEILAKTHEVIRSALEKARLSASDLSALGLTNQRETTLVWNPKTGEPWTNAIVWQDTRTDRLMTKLEDEGKGSFIRQKSGIPPATYFSAGKLHWVLENVAGVREAAVRGEAIFGNIDSWLLWNLTGGIRGGVHATDVTNASRTMLMDIETLEWDAELMDLFGIPHQMLPEIRPSASFFGETVASGPFGTNLPLTGIIGDQQAATVGQVCFSPGESKNTYGTGNFMLLNTGSEVVRSSAGLLTTVCYQLNNSRAVYALEGSVAVTGSAVQWLRDQMGLIQTADEIEELANSVQDNGGVYFVPAFSGLFAPYWRSDARGVLVGLSRYANRGHLARATLEAICYQTRDVLEAMKQDAGIDIEVVKVDGGATVNDTLMQLQADILGVSVVRPVVAETTSLGAAYAAGLAMGIWDAPESVIDQWKQERQWHPRWNADRRETGYAEWKKAIARTLDWIDRAPQKADEASLKE
jgi:glycerol kinase